MGVVTFIVISWMFAILLGLLPFFSGIRADPMHLFGFCQGTFRSHLFLVSSVLQLVVFAVCLSLVILFCVLIFCHVRRNTLEENVGVKRVIVKNLVYLVISNSAGIICPHSLPYSRDSW